MLAGSGKPEFLYSGTRLQFITLAPWLVHSSVVLDREMRLQETKLRARHDFA